MSNAIESGKVVTLALTVTDVSNGAVLQRFSSSEPTAYLHGHDDLVPALAEALEGEEVGHRFDLELADAYGAASADPPSEVPRKELPRDWRLAPGMAFFARGGNGQLVKLYVHGVRGSRVLISATHPWAGRTCRFEGEVLGARNATEQERQHGHAHGTGGHAH